MTSMQPLEPAETRSQQWRVIVAVVLIGVATLIAYAPALHGDFVWDDDAFVRHEARDGVKDLRRVWLDAGRSRQNYWVAYSAFWLEYQLWGAQPFGYHLVNVVGHACNAILVAIALSRLRVPGAWLAAAIFALHPFEVESVAWVSELKNVLSGFFYLLALLAYLRFADMSEEISAHPTRWRSYFWALGLFLCALLSKTVTSTLPAVLLLLLWWKRGRVSWRDAVPLLPFFALGAALGWMTIWLERNVVGARGHEFGFSLVERCLIAGRALWFYPSKLLWPHNLTFIYPRWQIDAHVWWQYLYPATAVVVVRALWAMRRRIGRGPLVATLFYAGTLVPALGFFDVYPFRFSFVADHFAYLASLGPIVLIAAVATALARRFEASTVLSSLAAGALLALLGGLTWQQTHIYADPMTLWHDTLAKNPGCWMAHNNLGPLLEKQGRFDEAETHYTEALRLKPDSFEGYTNLGNALSAQGKTEDAIAQYTAALQIEPLCVEAHSNLGIALVRLGRLDEAMAHYVEALRLDPRHAETHNNLATMLARQGKTGEAIAHLNTAVQIKPEYAQAHYNLATLLVGDGQPDAARAHFTAALQLKPDYAAAHNNLGLLLLEHGERAAAIRHFSEAVRLKPDFSEAQQNLQTALAEPPG